MASAGVISPSCSEQTDKSSMGSQVIPSGHVHVPLFTCETICTQEKDHSLTCPQVDMKGESTCRGHSGVSDHLVGSQQQVVGASCPQVTDSGEGPQEEGEGQGGGPNTNNTPSQHSDGHKPPPAGLPNVNGGGHCNPLFVGVNTDICTHPTHIGINEAGSDENTGGPTGGLKGSCSTTCPRLRHFLAQLLPFLEWVQQVGTSTPTTITIHTSDISATTTSTASSSVSSTTSTQVSAWRTPGQHPTTASPIARVPPRLHLEFWLPLGPLASVSWCTCGFGMELTNYGPQGVMMAQSQTSSRVEHLLPTLEWMSAASEGHSPPEGSVLTSDHNVLGPFAECRKGQSMLLTPATLEESVLHGGVTVNPLLTSCKNGVVTDDYSLHEGTRHEVHSLSNLGEVGQASKTDNDCNMDRQENNNTQITSTTDTSQPPNYDRTDPVTTTNRLSAPVVLSNSMPLSKNKLSPTPRHVVISTNNTFRFGSQEQIKDELTASEDLIKIHETTMTIEDTPVMPDQKENEKGHEDNVGSTSAIDKEGQDKVPAEDTTENPLQEVGSTPAVSGNTNSQCLPPEAVGSDEQGRPGQICPGDTEPRSSLESGIKLDHQGNIETILSPGIGIEPDQPGDIEPKPSPNAEIEPDQPGDIEPSVSPGIEIDPDQTGNIEPILSPDSVTEPNQPGDIEPKPSPTAEIEPGQSGDTKPRPSTGIEGELDHLGDIETRPPPVVGIDPDQSGDIEPILSPDSGIEPDHPGDIEPRPSLNAEIASDQPGDTEPKTSPNAEIEPDQPGDIEPRVSPVVGIEPDQPVGIEPKASPNAEIEPDQPRDIEPSVSPGIEIDPDQTGKIEPIQSPDSGLEPDQPGDSEPKPSPNAKIEPDLPRDIEPSTSPDAELQRDEPGDIKPRPSLGIGIDPDQPGDIETGRSPGIGIEPDQPGDIEPILSPDSGIEPDQPGDIEPRPSLNAEIEPDQPRNVEPRPSADIKKELDQPMTSPSEIEEGHPSGTHGLSPDSQSAELVDTEGLDKEQTTITEAVTPNGTDNNENTCALPTPGAGVDTDENHNEHTSEIPTSEDCKVVGESAAKTSDGDTGCDMLPHGPDQMKNATTSQNAASVIQVGPNFILLKFEE